LLEHSIEFPAIEGAVDAGDATGTLEAALSHLPARWAVALLGDENGQPLQLICLKNLREGLRNRLGESEAASRKVKWREVVRHVRWQLVDSDFEADWVYQQAAKQFFPAMYAELMRPNQAWFIHVDPDATFPRYIKTTQAAVSSGSLIGPFVDKHAAARMIELVEDAFDLCRYHHILTQYPDGKACAYKEMGKCPAPCDGSISIEQYRRLVEISVAGLSEIGFFIAQHTRRMAQAAAELRFETAAKIRAYVDQLELLRKGRFQHARPLGEFAFVTLQRGPAVGKDKLYLVLPGRIEPILGLISDREGMPEGVNAIWNRVGGYATDPAAAEIFGLVARHLLAPKPGGGVFIPLSRLSPAALEAARHHLSRNWLPKADKKRIPKGSQPAAEP
jgi:SAM-dependent methyltransferase